MSRVSVILITEPYHEKDAELDSGSDLIVILFSFHQNFFAR